MCKYQILFYYQLLNLVSYSIEILKGFVGEKTGLGKASILIHNEYSGFH